MMPLANTSVPALTVEKNAARAQMNEQLIVLMEAIAHGDQVAFTKLYDQTNRLVFSLAARVLNDRALAEEVTMDVYMQVWRQAANFAEGRGTALSWLMTIARTRAIDRLRAAAHLRHENETLDNVTHLPIANESPEKSSLHAEQRQIVRAALNQLSPEQRALIEAAYFGGLSQSELAAQFNLPLGTVKTRVRAGMLILKKELSGMMM